MSNLAHLNLKDCPFCPPDVPFYRCITASGQIMCGNCGARGPIARTPSEGQRLWNKRPFTPDECFTAPAPEPAPAPAPDWQTSGGVTEPMVHVLPGGRVDRNNAAIALGRSPKTLCDWGRLGVGPKAIKSRGRIFYNWEDVQKFAGIAN